MNTKKLQVVIARQKQVFLILFFTHRIVLRLPAIIGQLQREEKNEK
jgi:hypothetical protein